MGKSDRFGIIRKYWIKFTGEKLFVKLSAGTVKKETTKTTGENIPNVILNVMTMNKYLDKEGDLPLKELQLPKKNEGKPRYRFTKHVIHD